MTPLTVTGLAWLALVAIATLVFFVDCAALAGGQSNNRSWPSSDARILRKNAIVLGIGWAWVVYLLTP